MTGAREQKYIIQGDISSRFADDPVALTLATSFWSNSVSFAEMLIDSFKGDFFLIEKNLWSQRQRSLEPCKHCGQQDVKMVEGG